MTDPETASMKTKKNPKNPLDACLKQSFLGLVSSLLNHLVSTGLAWDNRFSWVHTVIQILKAEDHWISIGQLWSVD